jgi:outer membrane protein insertion porin family
MKVYPRRKSPVVSFLPVTWPVAGLSLLVYSGSAALAQATETKALSPPAMASQGTTRNDPQAAPAQDTKQNTPPSTSVIGEIIVTGNKVLNSASIVAAAGVKEGDPCTDQTISQVITRLVATGNFGMYSQTDAVRAHFEENNPPNGRCKLIIEVDENEPITSVSITGSGPIKPEEIDKLITRGPVFNEAQFLRDTIRITELYNKQGYIISFGQDAGPDEKVPGQLNVPIVVTRVAEIRIVKNRKTKRSVILREMQTKEGDYYNRIQFEKDRARLYNLDLFEEVIPEERQVGPGRVGLTLSLPEKRTGTISASVGYSNRQQLIGRIEVSENNFRGMAQTLNLLWETGGPAHKSSVILGFSEPWLDNRHTSLGVQAYDRTVYRFQGSLNQSTSNGSEVGTNDRYNEQHAGGAVTLSRPFRSTYRGAVTLRGEYVTTDPLDLSGVNASIIQDGPIVTIAGSIIHNTRDLDLDAVRGGYQSVNLEFGVADLQSITGLNGTVYPGLGRVGFSKLLFDTRQYYSLQGLRLKRPDEPKRAIALRFMLGTSVGTLPYFEQFFIGGADSLRGYPDDRFWGSNELLASIEYRHPLARSLVGVLFLDVGDAWGGSYQNVTIQGYAQSGFTVHTGIGFGIRVRTPIGPLRLDVGFGDEGARTHFSVGNAF